MKFIKVDLVWYDIWFDWGIIMHIHIMRVYIHIIACDVRMYWYDMIHNIHIYYDM